MERRYNINPRLTGRIAECDGGMMVAGGPAGAMGSREHFRGRLTGIYFEEGDPPWRWYEMRDLEVKPPEYEEDSVWCEAGFLFLMEGEDEPL